MATIGDRISPLSFATHLAWKDFVIFLSWLLIYATILYFLRSEWEAATKTPTIIYIINNVARSIPFFIILTVAIEGGYSKFMGFWEAKKEKYKAEGASEVKAEIMKEIAPKLVLLEELLEWYKELSQEEKDSIATPPHIKKRVIENELIRFR